MTAGRLIAKEIAYRRLNFALAALAVLVAVASVAAILTLLKGYRVRAEGIAEVQAARAGEVGFRLTDDARRLMLELGYNVLILDEQEDRAEFLSTHQPTRLMDEAVVEKLARSRKLLVQHLLPTLQQRLRWPEKDLPIVLIGTRGEVPLSHFDPKKPMIAAVPDGSLVAGSLVAERAGLAVGRTVTLLGREFTVSLVHERRGNDDDITVWVPLAEAQRLLDRPGKIHAILALGCLCVERLPGDKYHVRELYSAEELERLVREVVPTVQVIVLERAAAIRRATRAAAGHRAQEFLQVQEAGRASLTAEREALAAWVIPLVVIGGVVWVGLMALGNVRARRSEIGILRALGLGAGKMATIFLGRAVVVGLAGAVPGYAVGFVLAVVWDARQAGQGALAGGPAGLAALFGPGLLAGVLVLAPLLAAAASLVPALLAAQQDPADILREE
jgi:hypothetical protein